MSLKCILQGQDLSKESLEAHIADKNNPHGVTPQQIGAATRADIPSSLPASDVYSWAKQPNKPSYTYSEVGAAASNHNHNNLYPTLTDFNSLKTSVSNGKSAVASAITDKGVSTSATASFDTMAGNIRSISSTLDPIISNYGGILSVANMIIALVSNDYPIKIPTTITVDACCFGQLVISEGLSASIYRDLVIPFKQLSSSNNSTSINCSYSSCQFMRIYGTGYDNINKWVEQGSGTLEVQGFKRTYSMYINSLGSSVTAPYVAYYCVIPSFFAHYSGRNNVYDGSITIKKISY